MPTTKSKKSEDLTKLVITPKEIPSPEKLASLSKLHGKALRKTVDKLKKLDSKMVDEAVLNLHELAFGFYNCLDCGNCCNSISPAMNNLDVDHIAKQLRVKPTEVVVKYLRMDNEGDFVFRTEPCPFLCSDNRCNVYDNRPRACREYPHTDRRRFHQILDLTLQNATICPIVYAIFRKLETVVLV